MTQKENNELLPCPFCGEHPSDVKLDRKEHNYIGCHNKTCHIRPQAAYYDDPKDAVYAWNKRIKPNTVDKLCTICSIGFILPSGVCDHCNTRTTQSPQPDRISYFDGSGSLGVHDDEDVLSDRARLRPQPDMDMWELNSALSALFGYLEALDSLVITQEYYTRLFEHYIPAVINAKATIKENLTVQPVVEESLTTESDVVEKVARAIEIASDKIILGEKSDGSDMTLRENSCGDDMRILAKAAIQAMQPKDYNVIACNGTGCDKYFNKKEK